MYLVVIYPSVYVHVCVFRDFLKCKENSIYRYLKNELNIYTIFTNVCLAITGNTHTQT